MALESDWLREPDHEDAAEVEQSLKRSQPLVLQAEGEGNDPTPVTKKLWRWNAERFLSRAVKFTHRRLSTPSKEKLAARRSGETMGPADWTPAATEGETMTSLHRSYASSDTLIPPPNSARVPSESPPASQNPLPDPSKRFARRRLTDPKGQGAVRGFQSPIGLS